MESTKPRDEGRSSGSSRSPVSMPRPARPSCSRRARSHDRLSTAAASAPLERSEPRSVACPIRAVCASRMVRGSLRSNGALAAAVLSRSWDRARRLQEGLAGRGMETGLRVLPDERPSSRGFVAATLAGLAALVTAGVLAA